MNCAFCGSRSLMEVIDYGYEALAGGYLTRIDFSRELRFRLRLMFCESCYAVQLGHFVNPELLFRNYHYRTSDTKTGREHFKSYAGDIWERFAPRSVLEIGCNDGALLKHLCGKAERVVGVDPSSVAGQIRYEGMEVIPEFFRPGMGLVQFDVVTANNVFAHVEGINEFTRAVFEALGPRGVFVFEVHDLGQMISGLQYDWIYHEHLYYYSVLSLEKHLQRNGLRLFDVEHIPLHAGSRRYYACRDDRPETLRVKEARILDRASGLDRGETFIKFAEKARAHASAMREVLQDLRTKRMLVGGYGASGRANALMQHAGLGSLVSLMYDDSPARIGMFTPDSKLHINGGYCLRRDSIPDYLVVFAWSYLHEIRPKCGGRGLVIPFPWLKVESPKQVGTDAGWRELDGIGQWAA